MGSIVRLRQRHVRTSAISREAKAVKAAAVNLASAARPVASTAAHHSAGILLRWPHLVTAVTGAPTSAAMASRDGHRSIMDRNEVKSDITPFIGQSVLNRKDILALDADLCLGHTVRMTESETETEYKQQFIQRVAQSRIARGMKQWQIAEAMGIPQDKYKQYESRSLLPHHMIGRFCIICRVEPEWLVTGRGQKPIQPLKMAPPETEPVPKPAAKAKRPRSRRAA